MAEEKVTADPDVNKDSTSLLESYINDIDTANDDDSEEVEESTAGGGSEEVVQNKTPIITATQATQMLNELERFFESKNMLDAASWSDDLAEQTRKMALGESCSESHHTFLPEEGGDSD